MPLILAVEPDRRQASRIAAVLRTRPCTELVIAESAENALGTLAGRVPDVLLTSPLLSRQDEAAIAAWLRGLGPAAAHVQALTIPILAPAAPAPARRRGVLSVLRRGTRTTTPDGCEPSMFADQVGLYLERASAERDEVEAAHPPTPPLRRDLAGAQSAKAGASPLPPNDEWAAAPGLEATTEPEPAVAMFFEDAPAPAMVEHLIEAVAAPVDEVAAPVELVAAPVEEIPAPAETLAALPAEATVEPVAAIIEVVAEIIEPVTEIVEPVAEIVEPVAAMEAQALEIAALPGQVLPADAVQDRTALARLRSAMSAWRRRREPLPVDVIATAVMPSLEPVAIEEPTAAEPVVQVVEAISAPPTAIIAPDTERLWVAVPLEEIVHAPAAFAKPNEVPRAEDSVWVVTPTQIPEMFERFAAPAVFSAPTAFAAPAVFAPEPSVPAPAPKVQTVRSVRAPQPAAKKGTSRSKPKPKPVQDEWGFFDPDQCGFAALLAKLDEITEEDDENDSKPEVTVRVIAY